MDRQRVLLIGFPGLLVQGIHDILKWHHDMKVLSLPRMTVEAVGRIEAFSPDVLVVAGGEPDAAELICAVLWTFPDLPVVRVGLEKNRVYAHRSVQMLATSANLLGAIHDLTA
jgi:chemotaxis response regulator CheB